MDGAWPGGEKWPRQIARYLIAPPGGGVVGDTLTPLAQKKRFYYGEGIRELLK